MIFNRIDVKEKLEQVKSKSVSNNINYYKSIFDSLDRERTKTLESLENPNTEYSNKFIFDKLDTSLIFHASHIKKICSDYRLRFLSTSHFKHDYDPEAITKIHALEKEHNIKLNGFKIVAPFEAFKLKKADDPLLFAPMGNNYYYLIHKWGQDLHPLRKIKYWSFKNVDNLLISLTLISLLFTFLTYPFFISNKPSFGYMLMLFMFYFKGVVGMFFIFFGGTGKNFSQYSWQSQYDKIR